MAFRRAININPAKQALHSLRSPSPISISQTVTIYPSGIIPLTPLSQEFPFHYFNYNLDILLYVEWVFVLSLWYRTAVASLAKEEMLYSSSRITYVHDVLKLCFVRHEMWCLVMCSVIYNQMPYYTSNDIIINMFFFSFSSSRWTIIHISVKIPMYKELLLSLKRLIFYNISFIHSFILIHSFKRWHS